MHLFSGFRDSTLPKISFSDLRTVGYGLYCKMSKRLCGLFLLKSIFKKPVVSRLLIMQHVRMIHNMEVYINRVE